MADDDRTRFEELYSAFRARLEEPGVLQLSSLTSDYTRFAEYDEIIALGKDALPAVLDRLEAGDFLLNRAALEIAGLRRQDIVPEPGGLYSEQDLSLWILQALRGEGNVG